MEQLEQVFEDNFKVAKYFGSEFGRKEDELMIILQNLREKQSDLKYMNREVIMLLDEEELENDVIQCEEIEYNIGRTIQKISKELQSIKINENVSNVNNTSCAAVVKYKE